MIPYSQTLKRLLPLLLIFSTGFVLAEQSQVRGLIVADQEATLSTQLRGKINRINVRLGQAVKKGKVIIEFDCRIQRAEFEVAQAHYKIAEAQLSAQKDLQSFDVANELDLVRAENEMALRNAELKTAQAGVDDCYVRAPFSGLIADVYVSAHENVQNGQELVTVVSGKDLWFESLVPVAWLPLSEGDKLKLHVDIMNATYTATVKEIAAYIDPVTKTVKVKGQIESAPNLRPGLSAVITK